MDNTEKSELVIARILSVVQENGLQPKVLSFQDLDLDPEFESFFDVSVKWLIDEEIIRVASFERYLGGHAGSVLNPVITSNGYSMLEKPLLGGREGQTMGSAVKEISRSGGSYSKFGDFVGGFLGGFTKSMGSG